MASKIDRTTLRYTSTRPDDVLWREAKNSREKGADGSATRITEARRFRVLAIVDGYTRECLALAADTSLSPAHGPQTG